MALGTKMAWIRLGGRDNLTKDVLDSSTNATPYWTAE